MACATRMSFPTRPSEGCKTESFRSSTGYFVPCQTLLSGLGNFHYRADVLLLQPKRQSEETARSSSMSINFAFSVRSISTSFWNFCKSKLSKIACCMRCSRMCFGSASSSQHSSPYFSPYPLYRGSLFFAGCDGSVFMSSSVKA